MRNDEDEEDDHFYFKFYNHERYEGKKPDDSDEDGYEYTGCLEMAVGPNKARCYSSWPFKTAKN